ncbi:MAG: hypothetical protein HY910_06845 [Desulfarculus sp.]|nr:hypothetical protein [Desulfarculus sp.]
MATIEPLNEVRKGHIRQVLDHAKGDLDLACRILGIEPQDLPKLLATHGLEPVAPPDRPSRTPDDEE